MPTAFASPRAGVLENIEFAQTARGPLYLDASIPDGPGPFPAAIVVHGGGWVRGHRRTDVEPLFSPLSQARIAWFTIDYRLSDNITRFGAAVEDVESAIRFVRTHAGRYRVDSARIALVGESAGGQLAAMAALAPAAGADVKAVVALYAPTDLVALAQESTLIPQQLRDSLRGTPFEAMLLARLRQLSPVENIRRDAPPFLLIHGTADRLVPFSQSVKMCDRMHAAGAGCELYAVEGAGHGIRWWETANPRAAEAYKERMAAWLQHQLAP